MRKVIIVILCIGAWWTVAAEEVSQAYLNYIWRYKDIARAQQTAYGIPASITMAQALLESSAGLSELAVNARNHFGIKCTSSWEGKCYKHDDDQAQEEFRVYDSVPQSYEDHSLFLRRARYQSLYDIPIKNYRGWAHELRRCGYATDPKYPEKLIRLIELYKLDLL